MANLDREICPVCNGNGYVLSGVTVYQCSYCDSQGEIPKREASVEELQKVIEEFKIHRGVVASKNKTTSLQRLLN